MKNGYSTFVFVALVVAFVPAFAAKWEFDYEIYGNILESPARYGDGSLTSGGDGFIEITLDDTGWPTDPTERWDYLWDNYFEYDNSTPYAYKWVGTFGGVFYVEATNAPIGYNGWCEGTIIARITIWDENLDGVLDPAEKWGENLFDGTLSKSCSHASGGEMECMWGSGAIASNYFSFKMPPTLDTLYNGGNLNLPFPCPSANEESSWSSIKSLSR